MRSRRNVWKRMLAVLPVLAGMLILYGCGSDGSRWMEPDRVREEPLPARYDGREHGRTAPAADQSDLGTCWAFASLLALENAILPEESLDFSEDHMSNNPDFVLSQADGGEYTMAMAYLLSWRGPVLEQDDPYGDGESPEGLAPVKHVQEIQVLPSGEPDVIKRAVLEYGGVQSSLYTNLRDGTEASEYYNAETNAYCYPAEMEPNHDVVIVGWDDAFPKESFSTQVPGDGAFLCENSWGTQFGEDGFFYVSYCDANLGKVNVCYTSVEEPDNYDHIYQSDRCGWIGQIGYGSETAWAASVYTAGQRERLEAVGFYAVDRDSEYEVYVVPLGAGDRGTGGRSEAPGKAGATGQSDRNALPDLTNRRPAAAGHLEYAGYYTIPLGKAVKQKAGERFAVVVKLTTPGAVHPVAVEYDAGDGKCSIDLGDGEGYISPDGAKWERLETGYSCNVCLKAYSSDF